MVAILIVGGDLLLLVVARLLVARLLVARLLVARLVVEVREDSVVVGFAVVVRVIICPPI